MASGYIGEHYVSTYILQRLYWSTSTSGTSGHNVYVENQLRRTNWYGGSTLQYPSNSYISINGDRYDWSWTYQDYPAIPAYNNDWHVFCSRTVYVAHTSYAEIYIAGGNYNMGSYLDGDCGGTIGLEALISAPATPTAENLTSDGTPHKAYSKVTSNGWGTNSSRRNFEIICNGAIQASDSDNSPASMYWTLPNGSSDQNACAVITWYGRAVNNHVWWTDSGAKYIATPSAPIQTISAGSGTNPGVTISTSLKYKGGTQNSSTCNNGSMKRWSFAKMTSGESGVPSTFQLDSNNDTATTKSYTWDKSQFTAGTNYKFYTRAVNAYGGTSSTTSNVIYCPTGVSGSVASRTTTSIQVTASANYAGTIGSSTSGTMSCYQLKWGTSSSSLSNTIGPQTSTSFTISGLSSNQTIYFQITGWNTYGLSNVSSVLSATTLPRYNPEIGNITTTPKSPGADVTVGITHTGGLAVDGTPISQVKLESRPASSSSWSTLKNITGLSLNTGSTYTFTDAWAADVFTEGDYEFRVTISNGTENISKTFSLAAPSSVTLSNVTLVANQPIQIQATSTPTTTTAPYKYVFQTVGGAGTRTRTFLSTAASYHVTSPNYLLYNTAYTVTSTVYNAYGLWRKSSSSTVTTAKRVNWYYVGENGTKTAEMLFERNNNDIIDARSVTDVYYLVANALGNVSVGDSMNYKRLTFITNPLFYRPENVASITFSNGKRLAYDLDSSADVYKFGIWNGSTIETTFFDGSSWQASSYAFPSGYTVSAITHTGYGLNSSAPFSTTSCLEIPLWERN